MNKNPSITSITYERLVSLGNYENERLSVTANITLDETPEEVFEYLYLWVNAQLKTEKQIAKAKQRLQDLAYQESSLRHKINTLENRIEVLYGQLNASSPQTILSANDEEDSLDCNFCE